MKSRANSEPIPAHLQGLFRVSDDLLIEPRIARSMRRADRFIRMAAIAALDAWTHAEMSCAGVAKEQIGLIVTSGLGPHCRGFKFLDGILDSGDSDALPTDFSHSVHGAAASYIAGQLDLRGPSLTATDFEIGFEQAVLLAQCWLHQGTCQRVLGRRGGGTGRHHDSDGVADPRSEQFIRGRGNGLSDAGKRRGSRHGNHRCRRGPRK